MILDNKELPFYDERSTTKNVIFKKGDNEIRLSQRDWRDEYYIYNIEINNNKVFEISLRQYQDIPEAVELTMQKLRSLIP